ncbi:hypothetical protein K431DRAFT_289767 [Polychaeton citri CBS 116435]|uniref:Uncharacterized protein n=1 Tax=Polychaeton citri CBS 116435 TaxID=1314669 RepID=A0A9P4UKJ8_9PEZI|nr:hypothetical protein K431DRAFT_289767 [Polychaeton citri CBS 116435]
MSPAASYPPAPSPYTHLSTTPLWQAWPSAAPPYYEHNHSGISPLPAQSYYSTRASTVDSGYCEPSVYTRPFELEYQTFGEGEQTSSHQVVHPLDAAAPTFAPMHSAFSRLKSTKEETGSPCDLPSLPHASESLDRRNHAVPPLRRRFSEHTLFSGREGTKTSLKQSQRSHRRGNSIPGTPTSPSFSGA